MGQGNALHHLMPPPFYAYRMVVAKARAPEESISDQLDKIVDASATNRYKVEVMPGISTFLGGEPQVDDPPSFAVAAGLALRQ